MANLTPDLTGAHPDYHTRDKVFSIFEINQPVDLEDVVFLAPTFKVYLLGSVVIELVQGVDWIVDKLCYNAMSRMRIYKDTFNATLIGSIKMIRPIAAGTSYQISIEYQSLYPNQLRTAYHHGEPVEITPELFHDLIKTVEYLKTITNRSKPTTGVAVGDSKLFLLDTSKTNKSNYVEREIHAMNVAGGVCFISPLGGSFYKDSVTVFHPATNQLLVENVDYFISCMNEVKTKATSHNSSVHDHILLIKPIVDTVLVSYHAYGGEPTITNYQELATALNDVVQYLNEVQFISENNIGYTPAFVDMCNRVYSLEGTMRLLLGKPSYGDMTSGKTVQMKLFAPDSKMHWYTFASLYTVLGDTVPCTADTMHFRLQTLRTHIQMHVMVSVDLVNPFGNKFNVDIQSENYPKGYISYKDYSGVDQILRPQFRIVWNDDGNTISGAYLQLGFELKGVSEETIVISDLSGSESCWKLVDAVAETTTPKDNSFQLPNISSFWELENPKSRQEHMLVPYKGGHLLWAGIQPLNKDLTGWRSFPLYDHYLPENTDISRLTKVRLSLAERDGYQFPVDIPFATGGDHPFGTVSFTYQNLPAYITAEIYRDESGALVVSVAADIQAGHTAPILDIRDVIVYL